MTGDMGSERRQRLAEAKTYARGRDTRCSRRKAKAFADYYNLLWRRGVPPPPFHTSWDSWPRREESF